MSGRLGALPRWLKLATVPLLAIVIGVGVGIASSPASLTRNHSSGAIVATASPTPSPASSSPVPTVTQPGILGASGHLVAAGSSGLTATTSGLAAGSSDGGHIWTMVLAPANGSGVAIEPSNPLHAITGGSAVQFTSDGGVTWKQNRTPPPGVGPYQPLLISPVDGSVWFLLHQGKLLRTRDASLTWRELTDLPALTTPVIVPGHVLGQFFLASGIRVFALIDNGQQIVEQPTLPSGVTVVELAAVGGDQPTLLARGGDNRLFLLKGTAWVPLTGVTGGPIAAGGNAILLIGNGGAKLNSPGSISYSQDAGTTWRKAVGLASDQTVEAMAGQPSSITFFAYCYGGDMYRSVDGGRTWILLSGALRERTN